MTMMTPNIIKKQIKGIPAISYMKKETQASTKREKKGRKGH